MERSLISPLFVRRHRTAYFTLLILMIAVFALMFVLPLHWMITGALAAGGMKG